VPFVLAKRRQEDCKEKVKKMEMKLYSLRRMLVIAVISAVALFGMSISTNAHQQEQDQQDKKKDKKQKPEKQQKAQEPAKQAGQQGQRDRQQQSQPAPQQQQRAQRQATQQQQQTTQQQQRAQRQATQQQQQTTQQQQRAQRQATQQQQQAAQQQQQRAEANAERVGQSQQDLRLSQQRQQQLNTQQQQRLVQYRQQVQSQDRLWTQRSLLLQQQRRMAQYRFQQQYLERRRQQIAEQNSRSYDYNNDPNFYSASNYRYSRGGTSYETNQYGADLLRQAVDYGYDQGFQAGQADQQDRWRGANYQSSYAYQDANYGYNGYYIAQAEYSYYFREGFRRGYEDGLNSRSQYGNYSNGNHSILSQVLSQILNLSQF
jgi:hypothetical protein